ncbi:MAG: hypothetical protein H8M99_02210 [Gloeobacteraceae cyanobacterium ES-bin-144]|nr:hypothetical protein [Verrucomicrobiales bacterium]
MKMITTTIRPIFVAAIFGCLTSFAVAGPGVGSWKTARQTSDFSAMKPENHVVYVCNMCETISNVPVKSKEHAMEMCKDGAMMTCPSCKKTSKTVVKTPHGNVTFEDEKGKECGFMAMAADNR